MLNYQKLHFDRYYIMNDRGDTHPCTRRECFTAEEELPECTFRQRWFYDQEAGYAIRLPRNSMGDALGRRNQADLKFEERQSTRRATQISIDQPRNNEDGDDIGGMDFADSSTCVEQIV